MSKMNKFVNRMFRRVNGVVWDVMGGGVGLKTDQGIFTVSFSETGTPTLNVNPLDDFGLALPGFALQSSLAEINAGDIIVGDTAILGWVVKKNEASLELLDHNGHVKTYVPPKVAIMNTNGVLVVKNLFNLTGGAEGANNFASQLMPLLLLGGGDAKLEKMLPFLLMTAQAPAAAGTSAAANPFGNPLMMMLLMKDGGLGSGKAGGIDPLMLMALGGGGGAAANPLLMASLLGGDIFGGNANVESTPAPALNPVVRRGVPVSGGTFPPPLNSF
jgi:hypothetical protein